MNHPRTFTLLLTLAAVAAVRLLPHPWNFTPIGAMALFGGATLASRRQAFLIPMAAMLAGDLVLGFHRLMPAVYGCFALNVCAGFLLRERAGALRVGVASAAGSLVFFVVTNFAVWLSLGSYPHTWAGLMNCYAAGLPYLRNGILGDGFYAAVLFGGLALAERRFPALRKPVMVPESA